MIIFDKMGYLCVLSFSVVLVDVKPCNLGLFVPCWLAGWSFCLVTLLAWIKCLNWDYNLNRKLCEISINNWAISSNAQGHIHCSLPICLFGPSLLLIRSQMIFVLHCWMIRRLNFCWGIICFFVVATDICGLLRSVARPLYGKTQSTFLACFFASREVLNLCYLCYWDSRQLSVNIR